MTRTAKSIGILLALGALVAVVAVLLEGDGEEVGFEGETRGLGPSGADASRSDGAAVPELSGPTGDEKRLRPEIETTPFTEAPVWTAEHGDLSGRGGGQVRFEILDALGAPLDWNQYSDESARLWRHVGDFTLEEGVRLDQARDAVSCEGRNGVGLEPGKYTLEVTVGDYGVAHHEFIIGRRERLEETIRMPGFKRTVTLRFEDPQGKPVEFLDGVPTFSRGTSTHLPGRGRGPRAVLRSPPSPFNSAIGIGRGGRSGYWSSRRFSRTLYKTDAGQFQVSVIAGREGKIELKGSLGLFREKNRVITSDFLGAEWESRVVVVQPVKDYAKRVKRRIVGNRQTPGARMGSKGQRESRFHALHQDPDPLDVTDLSSGGHTRLILDHPDSALLLPRLFWLRGKGDSLELRGPTSGTTPVDLEFAQGVHFGEVRADERYALAIGDGAFLRMEAIRLSFSGEEISRVQLAHDARAVTVRIRSTPTLSAFGNAVTAILVPQHEQHAMRWHSSCRKATRVVGGLHEIRTFLHPTQEKWLDGRSKVHIGIGERAMSFRRGYVNGVGRQVRAFSLVTGRELSASIREGMVEIDLVGDSLPASQRRLVLRVVGPGGEGLPWVEASLMAEQDDELARAMREVSRGLKKDGTRGKLETSWVRQLDEYDPNALLEDEAIASALGKEAASTFGTKEMQRRLYSQGAWYDTHHKARSDRYGYVFMTGSHLKPGKRFVLYLWSSSRDDLQPDRRIVFVAEKGVTDLGIIRLAGH